MKIKHMFYGLVSLAVGTLVLAFVSRSVLPASIQALFRFQA